MSRAWVDASIEYFRRETAEYERDAWLEWVGADNQIDPERCFCTMDAECDDCAVAAWDARFDQ